MSRRTPSNRRPLAAQDLRFNRTVAVVVLVIGVLFVWSLAFSAFDVKVRFQWEVEPDGTKTPMTHITCPSPWSVLVNDAEPAVVTSDGFCVMPSRSLALEAAIVATITLAVASWFLTRTTRPGALPPLPVSVREPDTTRT